jgi:multidrug efflux pump
VKRYVQPRLSVLPGAADVRVFGERQVRCASTSIARASPATSSPSRTSRDAIRRQNAEIPAGRIESSAREFTVVAETDVRTPEQFNNIIVANAGGYPVRIRDIGNAEIGPVDERTVSRFNGKPVAQYRRHQAGGRESARASRMPCAPRSQKINAGLPTGMKLFVAVRHVGVHRPLYQAPCSARSAEAIRARWSR